MDWLNYHHLFYFWTVAQEGTIARASEVLGLSQPTISAQIRDLERASGTKLFVKQGRNLALTDAGKMAARYAEEIFSLGRELRESFAGRRAGHKQRLAVGVADSLPKLVVYRLLEPALHMTESVQLHCSEGQAARLVSELATHSLDVVLSDAPLGPGSRFKVYNHQLGECGITLFGTTSLKNRMQGELPHSLTGVPMLMPTSDSTLRRSLDGLFESIGVFPQIVGEFADSALMKSFGQAGTGIFPAPSVVEAEVCRQYQVEVIGRLPTVTERFYAISIERRITHPAVVAIRESARRELFGTTQ